MPFFDTKDRADGLEIPPADDGVFNGTIMNSWQTPLEDVGPAGADKGKGGKYLIVPPDYGGKLPAGYIASPRARIRVTRCCGRSEERQRCRHRKGRELRPEDQALSARRRPPSLQRRHSAMPWKSSTTRRSLRLALLPGARPVRRARAVAHADKAMIDPLKSIGVEKGKPFNPDDLMKLALNEAAARKARRCST